MLTAGEAKITALADAIAALAEKERRPTDLVRLLQRGDRLLDQIASASVEDLIQAIDEFPDRREAAAALGYAAGLALQLRQCLRHYYTAGLGETKP
jgi:hypothetical protein